MIHRQQKHYFCCHSFFVFNFLSLHTKQDPLPPFISKLVKLLLSVPLSSSTPQIPSLFLPYSVLPKKKKSFFYFIFSPLLFLVLSNSGMIGIGSFGVKECSWKKWFFWIIPHSWGCFKFLKFDSFWSITPNLHFILITRLWNFVGFCGFLKKVRIFIDSGERICGESINFVFSFLCLNLSTIKGWIENLKVILPWIMWLVESLNLEGKLGVVLLESSI